MVIPLLSVRSCVKVAAPGQQFAITSAFSSFSSLSRESFVSCQSYCNTHFFERSSSTEPKKTRPTILFGSVTTIAQLKMPTWRRKGGGWERRRPPTKSPRAAGKPPATDRPPQRLQPLGQLLNNPPCRTAQWRRRRGNITTERAGKCGAGWGKFALGTWSEAPVCSLCRSRQAPKPTEHCSSPTPPRRLAVSSL